MAIKSITEEDLAHGLLGTLTIMARIIDAHRLLIEKLKIKQITIYPTVEAYTIQVVARMKDGRFPEEIIFREVEKHFLN